MDDRVSKLQIVCLSLILIHLSACNTSPSTSMVAPSIAPTPTMPPFQVARDIVFASSLHEDGGSWSLDVYAPKDSGNWPVVVFLPGLNDLKRGFIRESQVIAERGAIVYTLNWPTWLVDLAERENGKGFREMYEVVACGIRYAKATASDYGGDPSHVTLIGFSYGGYLGSWIALGADTIDSAWDDHAANNEGPPVQVECESDQASIKVDAFIGIGGVYFSTELLQERNQEVWEIVSPLTYLGSNLDMPIRLLHGERDTKAKPEFSEEFRDILLEAGYDTQLIMYDGSHRVPPELTAEIVQDLAGGDD
jgi:dienelactone hydrolase